MWNPLLHMSSQAALWNFYTHTNKHTHTHTHTHTHIYIYILCHIYTHTHTHTHIHRHFSSMSNSYLFWLASGIQIELLTHSLLWKNTQSSSLYRVQSKVSSSYPLSHVSLVYQWFNNPFSKRTDCILWIFIFFFTSFSPYRFFLPIFCYLPYSTYPLIYFSAFPFPLKLVLLYSYPSSVLRVPVQDTARVISSLPLSTERHLAVKINSH